MKINILSILFICITLFVSSQEKYSATVDLTKVENDKIKVVLDVPELEEKNQLFIFPKIVPGTYQQYDFGRFSSEFKAFTEKGRKLRVKRNDISSYRIKKGHKIARIEYYIEDTYDDFEGDNFVFQPGGTNIEEGYQFVFNNFGFFGYFQQYPLLPYELQIIKPEGFYGATSLYGNSTATKDVFKAENYVELVDQPILYSEPDTITYMEDGALIGLAVSSPDSTITAALLKETIQPLTEATSFILGNIPTDEYWFLFDFFTLDDPSFRFGGGGFGALEHKKSSFYYLPIITDKTGKANLPSILQTVSSIAAHEFLHILSPLNLHSEEIAYFDFYEPEMSKHLWLYEGVTEYLSIKSRLLGGLTTIDDFTKEIEEKINEASRYEDMSFTEMSKRILEPEISPSYGNVYLKGALIAMILDIKIAEVTNGEEDLIDLILELIKEYGTEKPFKDNELFSIIEEKTSPEIMDFFTTYVEGAKPLPFSEEFAKVGLNYKYGVGDDKYSFGEFDMRFDGERGLLLLEPEEGNTILPQPLSIAKLNGEKLSFSSFRKLVMSPENDNPLTITHMEADELKDLTVQPVLGKGDLEHSVSVMKEMTEEQEKLFRRLFINK